MFFFNEVYAIKVVVKSLLSNITSTRFNKKKEKKKKRKEKKERKKIEKSKQIKIV